MLSLSAEIVTRRPNNNSIFEKRTVYILLVSLRCNKYFEHACACKYLKFDWLISRKNYFVVSDLRTDTVFPLPVIMTF